MFLSKSAGVLTVVDACPGRRRGAGLAPGFRTFISDVTSPGIDNGVRDADAPRPPRPYPTDLTSRSSGVPYLRGSIIVKFRPGTGPAAQQAMLARAGASKMDAPVVRRFQHRRPSMTAQIPR